MRTALSKKDLKAIQRPEEMMTIQPEGAKVEEQSYTEQIVKYIPAEVVAFYIPAVAAAVGLKPASAVAGTISAYDYVVFVVFLLALVGTFVYMRKNAKTELEEKKIAHAGQRSILKAVISTIALLIWALYLGGPFAGIVGYQTYGTLAILGFTFFAPAIYDAIPIPFPFLQGS